MIRFRTKRVLAATIVIVALGAFLLPAFVAFRYTAPEQRNDFVRRPWRGWAFAYAALAVPGDAQLKTSGMALRKADWLYKGTAIDPHEVQLLFVPRRRPYLFSHNVAGRLVETTVTPSYRFMWQVQGAIDPASGGADAIVAILDYETGRLLYDVRDDLPEPGLSPEAAPSSPAP